MNTNLTLNNWWQRQDDSLVAISLDGHVTFADFCKRVHAWKHTLQSHSGQRWAVYHSDAAEFLAIICALWQLAKTACVAGDNLAATQQGLTASVDGFIGEFDSNTVQLNPSTATNFDWIQLAESHPALEVYTSGSTGKPKRIVKTMAVLQAELNALTSLMDLQADYVLATVSHQHLYGLTFRLLRPFCQQQAFCQTLLEYPEDIIGLAKKIGSFSLISSPAHLTRFTEQQDWSTIAEQCVDIYSSAAPLARAGSMHASGLLFSPVKEIYGSSETGALAWRCQQESNSDALWQALPHVQLQASTEAELIVSFVGSTGSQHLADQVRFNADGHFSLLGRADQLVKVEGKRLSLNEMATKLANSGLLDQAKVILLQRKRTETAVVACLSEQGKYLLQNQGRKQLIAQLKQFLKQYYEAVLLPRRWRFVEQLPYNSQGKLPMTTLTSLFEDKNEKWPEILAEQQSENKLVLELRLPEALLYFDGHFEQQAILPGVVQVHWAQHYAEQLLSEPLKFIRLEVIKFQKLMLPEQQYVLTLNYDTDKKKISFEYSSQQGIHSSGRICYE